jgi:hypothetical protein
MSWPDPKAAALEAALPPAPVINLTALRRPLTPIISPGGLEKFFTKMGRPVLSSDSLGVL